MDDRFDLLAKHVGAQAPRRRVLTGLGAMALGAMGILGSDHDAEAKNKCKKCKNKCHRKNKKNNNNNNNKKNCKNKCRNKCKNKND